MGKVDGPTSLWEADPPAVWIDETVGRLLARQAAATPDTPAVHWLGDDETLVTWTYGDLHARVASVATAVRASVGLGGCLAVCAPNSLEWVVAFYAAAQVGSTFVPLNPAMGEHELEQILELNAPALVLGADEFRGVPLGQRLQRVADRLPRPPQLVPLVEFVDDARAEAPDPLIADDVSAPVLVQYTSGSSGRPKGAVITHSAALNIAANFVHGWGHGPHDVLAGPLPLHHVAGTIGGLLANLTVGASFAFLPAYEPTAVIQLLEATHATVLAAVPTMLFDLQRQPGFDPRRLSDLRIVLGGGSVVPESTVRDIEATFGVEFLVAYGQSESVGIAQTFPGDPPDVKARTIGHPNPGREVKIADAKTSASVPVGLVGEICQRSSQQMTHYLGMPDATAATIDADGWLHTGDLGSMDDAGNITFRGRLRDVIIRGGENVYPEQVEAAYADALGVTAIAIVAGPDERWGEVPVGVVVLAAGARLDEGALENHGRRHLAPFQVPRRWVAVDELPLTASGKVRKVELERQVSELLTEPESRRA
ncbi:MAG: class I adenylate-forming enzyme family protein [Acidimicrobiia bacterium]